ncbi:MAG: hypothetical protein IN808_09555, partial [Rubrobacter sp.]|nr:hypothetical protein [Rubrobacter sp.]
MNSTRNNLIILGLVFVLLAVSAYLIFIRQPVAQATQLGLDLKGGVRVQLEGYQNDGSEVTREEMQRAVEIIRQRVDSLGVTEPEIRLQGQNQVLVDLPGISDRDRAVEVIGRTAQLGFYEVLAFEERAGVPEGRVDEAKQEIRESLRQDDAYREGRTKILFEESPSPDGQGVYVAGYVVREHPDMTGDAVESANLGRDPAGRLQVEINLTGKGGDQFFDLTRQIVDNALERGEPGTGRLAIVLDQDVVSAPVVDEPIPGGQVVIQNTSSPTGLPEQ